jgi:hypothetical protein
MLPKIEFLDKWPFSDCLGLTDFDRGEILVPIFKNSKDREIAELFSEYILGHEFYVEWQGRPENENQHAELEADYLVKSLGNGNLTGLAYHKIGLERDHDFSKKVSKYADVDYLWKKAKEIYGLYMDELKAGIEILLGLRFEYV